jgi:hypothetical protein
MNLEISATRVVTFADKHLKKSIVIMIVDSDPSLYGDRNRYSISHGFITLCDQARRGHEARTDAALFDAITRASAVKVNFLVSGVFNHPCRLRELVGITTTQLDRGSRVFGVFKKLLIISMDQGACGKHLAV